MTSHPQDRLVHIRRRRGVDGKRVDWIARCQACPWHLIDTSRAALSLPARDHVAGHIRRAQL